MLVATAAGSNSFLAIGFCSLNRRRVLLLMFLAIGFYFLLSLFLFKGKVKIPLVKYPGMGYIFYIDKIVFLWRMVWSIV